MQRQRVAHVLEVDELGDLAVRVAGDVDQRPVAIRRRVQPVNRHDREELPERPVIEQRLEDGKIADVLVAQRGLEFLHFLGHITQPSVYGDDLLRDLPVNAFDLRFAHQLEQPEIEHLLRFLLDLLRIVQAFHGDCCAAVFACTSRMSRTSL